VRVAAIVGSIVGVLGLIGIVSAIIILRRRRRSAENIYTGLPETHRGPLSPKSGSVTTSRNSVVFIGSDRIASSHNNSTSYIPLSRVIDGNSPPSYFSMRRESNLAGSFIFHPLVQQDDELGRWAAENRSLVPYELEQRLRAAQYLPSDDPDEIAESVWQSVHHIGHFEVKRLREIYAR
jgi:hypothetical protein